MTVDIDHFLAVVDKAVKDADVPVVDLIAVQTRDPFKVLVATILSSRTKDEVTAKASKRLFNKATTPSALAQLSEETIAGLIYPVGFYKTKARHLKKLPNCLEQFSAVVPDTIDELVQLPGVGRKTANLVVSVAFGKPAICVDTHVHRIMNIWKYVATKTPLQTEMTLRKILPERHWIKVNSLLVAFGQSICRPVGPKCDICPLCRICPQQGVVPRKIGGKKKNRGELRFISWNVNGIRAVEKKGFADIIAELNADIIGIQETKAQPDQLSETITNIDGYTSFWHSAERKGYSGVGFYTRLTPLNVEYGLGDVEFDCEGRVITLEFEKFFITNIYFPNAGSELQRLDYKLRFDRSLLEFAKKKELIKPIILCGDFNVAHKEIDLKNPKNNEKNAGFTPEERQWMNTFVEAGFIDTFRMFDQRPEQYTWWSYRFSARKRNIGWRIDYFCVSENGRKGIRDALIKQDVMGSDHCPVELVYYP
ncbi:exodeoxyribonuclease III [Desulforhopalus singaporensis]|uniref:Exodeoxyribonuclease-3 n=1 Tax=Desulforhopalus singaporensis TaxID=91360 RepID=A0A1H0UA24_9BACT|nr:exodeoxyribonuclease III [Desulforhopalus singaporensis]SDP62845.1 exodeoxyribonuclease-3 [Desulforhopalus singaporensis]